MHAPFVLPFPSGEATRLKQLGQGSCFPSIMPVSKRPYWLLSSQQAIDQILIAESGETRAAANVARASSEQKVDALIA